MLQGSFMALVPAGLAIGGLWLCRPQTAADE
jgi:hypothetical protein